MDKSFLGKGWKFPPTFNRAMDSVELVSEEQDIRESLNIILSTAPGERTMQPDFGCDIHHHVFDVMNNTTIHQLKDDVKRAILNFEPRIDLQAVEVSIGDELRGRLNIYLEFVVRTTNSRSNMVYPFYINEGTNVSFELN